jgi:hypothetical protein
MDYTKLTPPELANLSKMSGDDIKLIELTKLWLTAATIVIAFVTLSVGATSAIDRIETGHAIVTTTQTVSRPDGLGRKCVSGADSSCYILVP